MRFLLFICVVAVMVGCNQKIAPTMTERTKDSVIVKEVVRHDTIKIPASTITVTKFIECDSLTHQVKPFEIKQKKDQVSIDVKVNQGQLTATSNCDSLLKVIDLKDQVIEHFHRDEKTITVTKIVHDPYWYDIAARWIASITLIFIAAFMVITYLKTKTKLL